MKIVMQMSNRQIVADTEEAKDRLIAKGYTEVKRKKRRTSERAGGDEYKEESND